jgi:hypothetical protein
MPSDKAPGPNGFNELFIKKCWHIIKEEVYQLCFDFFNEKIDLQVINSSFITLPKYYGESDPRKFLMSYEATIALSGGDDTTLAKSFIISLMNAAANWYARLPLRSIASWAQLKEKFLVNFQGFHADLSTEEDFFSRANNMKERHCQISSTCSFILKHKPQRSQMSKP